MNLTTKGRYAVTAILDLAGNSHGTTPVSLQDISVRQNISLPYLEQIFSKLKSFGLVRSVRGAGGGYILAKEIDMISVADIIFAVDESIKMTGCGHEVKKLCSSTNAKCLTHELWDGLEQQIENYLASKKISDILKKTTPETKHINI